jgi:hypothetical protein
MVDSVVLTGSDWSAAKTGTRPPHNVRTRLLNSFKRLNAGFEGSRLNRSNVHNIYGHLCTCSEPARCVDAQRSSIVTRVGGA